MNGIIHSSNYMMMSDSQHQDQKPSNMCFWMFVTAASMALIVLISWYFIKMLSEKEQRQGQTSNIKCYNRNFGNNNPLFEKLIACETQV
eukprot:403345536